MDSSDTTLKTSQLAYIAWPRVKYCMNRLFLLGNSQKLNACLGQTASIQRSQGCSNPNIRITKEYFTALIVLAQGWIFYFSIFTWFGVFWSCPISFQQLQRFYSKHLRFAWQVTRSDGSSEGDVVDQRTWQALEETGHWGTPWVALWSHSVGFNMFQQMLDCFGVPKFWEYTVQPVGAQTRPLQCNVKQSMIEGIACSDSQAHCQGHTIQSWKRHTVILLVWAASTCCHSPSGNANFIYIYIYIYIHACNRFKHQKHSHAGERSPNIRSL